MRLIGRRMGEDEESEQPADYENKDQDSANAGDGERSDNDKKPDSPPGQDKEKNPNLPVNPPGLDKGPNNPGKGRNP